MGIIVMLHSTLVPQVDTTQLIIPTSVGCPSLTNTMDNVHTFGAMQQGYVNLVPVHATVLVLGMLVELLHHLLAPTTIVSQVLTRQIPTGGTPPTHCGTVKAATAVAGAATSVVHRGSGRP